MIAQLKQVLLVTRFESKMLLRSWAFRIISFLCFLVAVGQTFGMMMLIYFVSAETYLGPLFTSSNITLLALTQVTGLLIWTVVFFANDIGSRDRRIGVGDVVGSRPLSDGQYVLGRILGLLLPLIVLMAASLVASLLITQAFGLRTASFSQYAPFFLYFCVLSVAFAVALTTLLSTLLRNRLLTSLIAIAVIMAFGGLSSFSVVFDIGGFRVSGIYSELVGYGPIAALAMHRITYLLLTLFLISATIFAYPRSEAARRSRLTKASLATFSMASAAFLLFFVVTSFRAEARQQAWAEALREASANQAAGVSHYDMDIELLPRKGAIRGKVALTLVNRSDSEEDTFVFVLNPGLDLDALTVTDDPAVRFERRGPLVELTLSTPLPPGAAVESVWEYGGRIDPHAAWLAGPPPGETWWERVQQLDQFWGGLSGWIGRRFCFLLPESHWYPIPNSTFGHTYPDKRPANFATAQIRLHMPDPWTGVTQGQLIAEERSDHERVLVYEVDTPVPQFSLCAGEYVRATTEVDGIELAFFYASVHGENVDLFADAAEELERVISESLEHIEDELGLAYPYKWLSLVEVPSSCRSFSDSWDGHNLFVQPGVLLLSETDFFKTYFEQSYERAQRRTKSEGTGATDAQIKAELLRRYFTRNAFGGDLELNLLPNYWEFQVDASGIAYPAIGSAFTATLAETALGRHQHHSAYARARLSQPANVNVDVSGDGTEVNMGGGNPFAAQVVDGNLDRELLKIPLDSMTPVDQEEEFIPLVNRKTIGFLDTLAMAMGEEAWSPFLLTVLDAYRFKPFTLADLELEAGAYSGQDLSWVFEQFVTEAVMPGYAIGHAEAYEIDNGQRERLFQTVVRIANLEEGKGYVKLIFELEKSAESETVERDVYLTSLEAKEIRMVLLDKPASVRLVSPYSRNVQDPVQTLYVPKELRSEPGQDSVRTVDSVTTELAVVVDDLDEGFSTVTLSEKARTRVSDSSKEGDAEDYPAFRGFRAPRHWQEETADGAYGKYQRTRKIKRGGDGSELAVWAASLPQAGTYEVYFFMDGKSSGRYQIAVDNGESTREIDFGLENAKSGWNSLGKYKFMARAQARVTLSDELHGGTWFSRINADAVKWVYRETSDAVQ